MPNCPWRVCIDNQATIVDVNWSATLKVKGKEFTLRWREDHVLATCGNRSFRVTPTSPYTFEGYIFRLERVW